MSFLKNAINAIDPTPDKKKELTLAVNLLFELAEQKNALQEEALKELLRTAGTPENPTIPITNTLAFHSETRAYVKSNASTLVDTVTGAVKKFINGGADNIVDGIGELVTGGLEAILGAGSGSQASMHSYYIIVEGLSIVRFDIMAWQRKIEATGITTEIENAMTFTAFKSSVDVDKITFNTFLQAYKNQLEKLKFTDAELIAFIKKSKEVFELLRDSDSNKNLLKISGLDSNLLMPAEINFIDTSQPIMKRSINFSSLSASRKTYSFRLAYEVYDNGEYKGTVKTNWVDYYKGHQHGVQPSPKEITNDLIVLVGEVDTWCGAKGIIPPTPQIIQVNYDLETKSGRG